MTVSRHNISVRSKYGNKIDLLLASDDECIFVENDAVEYGEASIQLLEGREYDYEFLETGYTLAGKSELVYPSPLNRGEYCRGRIKTGIFVGSCSFDVLSQNEVVASIPMEIKSVKADYRTDYRQMMSDITKYYTDLVMQQGSPVTNKFEVDPNATANTLYQKYAFVKYLVEGEQFSDSLHAVMTNPIHRWKDCVEEKKIYNVKRLNSKNIRELSASGRRTAVNHSDYGLPPLLNSLPHYLTVHSKEDTLDIEENRFVKYVLYQFHSFCSAFQGMKNASEQLKNESSHTSDVIVSFLNQNFFKDVSSPLRLELNSPALQRKEGYREILQAWLMFDLAAVITWKGGDNVYEAGKKNVAALYEYWLFFKLLEIIGAIFKISPEDKQKLVKSDNDNINLDLVQGRQQMVSGIYDAGSRILNVRFYYNRSFWHQGDMGLAGSWTAPMRPDYTLSLWPGEGVPEEQAEKEDTIVHIHFDAKYRVEPILEKKDFISSESALSSEKDEQKQGVYKRADLLKMHAYKDAIRRTSGAYILYPGTQDKKMRGFHEIIPGLGAFSIKPSNYDADVKEIERFIKRVVQHLLDRTSQRERIAKHDHVIHEVVKEDSNTLSAKLPESISAEETYVLVGYYNERNECFILNNGYNVRIGDRTGSVNITQEMASCKYALLYSSSRKNIKIYKLKEKGRIIQPKSELIRKGYMPHSEKEESYYLIFPLDAGETEKELMDHIWDWKLIDDFVRRKSNANRRAPQVVSMSNLLRLEG